MGMGLRQAAPRDEICVFLEDKPHISFRVCQRPKSLLPSYWGVLYSWIYGWRVTGQWA
jgi:hypothetical protein